MMTTWNIWRAFVFLARCVFPPVSAPCPRAPFGCCFFNVVDDAPEFELRVGYRLLVDVCPLVADFDYGLWAMSHGEGFQVVLVDASPDDESVTVWNRTIGRQLWRREDLDEVMIGRVEWVASPCLQSSAMIRERSRGFATG